MLTVNQRQELGHWEVDTVLSIRKGRLTFVERYSCLFWALKTPDWTAQSFLNKAFESFIQIFGNTVKSIKVDHGKEFSQYHNLEQHYGLIAYFCHTYSPWE